MILALVICEPSSPLVERDAAELAPSRAATQPIEFSLADALELWRRFNAGDLSAADAA